jgi:hypothetical protein
MSYGYCTVKDVVTVFGRRNISSWADIDNTGNSKEARDTQDERIAYFIVVAAEQLNARLRNRAYQEHLKLSDVPPEERTDTPHLIKHLNAVLTGLLMFDARVTNYSAEEPQQSLRTYRQWSESVIEDLNTGAMKLGGAWESKHRSTPEVIPTNQISTTDALNTLHMKVFNNSPYNAFTR